MTEGAKPIQPAMAISGIVPMRQISLTSISSDGGTTRLDYIIRPEIPSGSAAMFDYLFDLESGDAAHPIDGSEGAFLSNAEEGRTTGWRLLERDVASERWTLLLKSPPTLATRAFIRISIHANGEAAHISILDKSDNCEVTET